MKLKCKIKDKYLKQILNGEKKIDYRQIESIIFVDESGKEHEFEVKGITLVVLDDGYLKENYPDIEWKDNLPTIGIRLGKKIEEKPDMSDWDNPRVGMTKLEVAEKVGQRV